MTEAAESLPDEDGGDAATGARPRALHVLPDAARSAASVREGWSATRFTRGRHAGDADTTAGARVRRLPGLDGLRAVAVVAVVVFHLDFALLPGGFLGVDVFFVISGFLITNLIARELLATNGFDLRRFYLRRARRLLPSVVVLLAVVVLAADTVWRDQLATLRGGVLSSLVYVTNWWLIADHQSYFVETGRPTMVQHLWSLAVEEQYYLVWSVVIALIAGTLLVRRAVDPVHAVLVAVRAAAALAIASALVMAAYAIAQDVPYRAGTSRVYFGSDTHSTGLFVGSAAGAYLALRVHRGRTVSARWAWLTDVVGGSALVVLVLQFRRVDEFSVGLYRGGFLLFDVLVLVVIACAVRPAGLLGRMLDMRPVRWIGRRSYAIYLWHWPVAVVTRPGVDIAGPVWLIDVERVVLVVALASLSYRFVEVPFRAGARRRPAAARRPVWPALSMIATLGCVVGLVLAANPVDAVRPAFAAPTTRASAAPQRESGSAPARPCSDVHRNPALRRGPSVSAFGDSVLVGAQSALRSHVHALQLDAVEGRQAYDVLDDVLACAAAHTLQPDVLLDVGDNGIIAPDQLSRTLRALHGVRRVVLLTVRVPRDWQDPNNRTIRSAAAHARNVTVVDWNALSRGRSAWFYGDGIHLTRSGARAYVRAVVRALR